MEKKTISVIRGDGIGPEIMSATIKVLDALDCGFHYEFVDAGMSALSAHGELLPQATLKSIERNKVALKGPLTTPVEKGFSSINMQLRKHFVLFANVRPAVTFPGVKSRYSNIDILTIRENTEGAYLAEGQHYSEDGESAFATIKTTRHGSERLIRYAFELAKQRQRKKITVVHKANIIKSCSGMFLDVARLIAPQYPDISMEEMIVDNACMQLVINPNQFDILVTTNLFGDILSDLCAGLVGGLGMAPGSNIGADVAIFEAMHGSAPDIAGKSLANPCALLLASAEMLDHLNMRDKSSAIRSAISNVLDAMPEMATPDLGGKGTTMSFTNALIAHCR